ncbi:MAG TPA: hypothetical protein VM490_24265 [Armatimonadaceae bacterium]|nr:hypothetical protein [Armatimonadaceae bacterium]
MSSRIEIPPATTRKTRMSAVMWWFPESLLVATSLLLAAVMLSFGAPFSVAGLFILTALGFGARIAYGVRAVRRNNDAVLAARGAQLDDDDFAAAAAEADTVAALIENPEVTA